MAENNCSSVLQYFCFRFECPAEDRPYAKEAKEVFGNSRPMQKLRLFDSCEYKRLVERAESGYSFERAIVILDVQKARIRHAEVGTSLRRKIRDGNDPLCIAIWWRPQQNCIHN